MDLKDLKLVNKHFKESEEHHDAMRKSHATLAEEHHAVAHYHKEEGTEELHKRHKSIAAEHEALAQHHADRSKHFAAMRTEAAHKIAEDELAKGRSEAQPLPPGISRVLPENPRLRAIPRPGQQPLVDKTQIPLELQKAFVVGDERENPAS